MRVLICDDQSDMRLLLRLIVQSFDHEAAEVCTPAEAIEACAESRPDLLLLDVEMPLMDGPTLLRELRARGIEPPRTLLVSAITPTMLRRIADELGVGYVTKPFTSESILEALTQAA